MDDRHQGDSPADSTAVEPVQQNHASETPAGVAESEAESACEGGEASTDSFLLTLVQQTLPDQVGPNLKRLLGSAISPSSETGRYDISVAGRFEGAEAVELLSYAKKSLLSGALVFAERDEERVLYLSRGALIGAASTVLFESLGRILYQAGVVKHEDSSALVDAEEHRGPHALLLWIPSEHLLWACERRLWEVVAAVYLIKGGHFMFVQGEPALEGPTVYLDPTEVALEGKRRKEEWHSGSSDSSETYRPPSMGAPPSPITRRLRPIDIGDDALDVLLTRIREAEAATTKAEAGVVSAPRPA